MPSTTDFDQGGTFRSFSQIWLGPSAGFIRVPAALLPITAAGTYQLVIGTVTVTVNVSGAVTIKLPSAINPPSAMATTVGALFADQPITIVDVGGFAGASPITIMPFSVAEKIMGLASITISINYGAYTLAPNSAVGGWNAIAP
jgi:hypothetical protein